MSLETASYIHQLNSNNPSGADRLKDGDDHIRMIKAALKATFPGLTGPLDPSVTHTLLNSVAGLLVPVGVIVLWSGLSTAVPDGWAICDGRTVSKSDGTGTVVTPDMRDRVAVGVSDAHPLGTAFGQYSKTYTTEAAGGHGHIASSASAGTHNHTGSVEAHVLTLPEIPSHNHYVVVPGTGDNNTSVSATLSVTGEKTSGSDSGYRLLGTNVVPTLGPTSPTGGGQGHVHTIPTDGAHTHPVTIEAATGHSHGVAIDTSQPALSVFYIMKV